ALSPGNAQKVLVGVGTRESAVRTNPLLRGIPPPPRPSGQPAGSFLKPREGARLYLLPASDLGGIRIQGREAAVKFVPLSLGEWELFCGRGHAVPNLLN